MTDIPVGYKQTEVGIIPNDWNSLSLGETLSFRYGEGNRNPSDGGQYPVYGANGIIGGYSKYNAEASIIIGHMGEYAGSVLREQRKHFVTYNGTITKSKNINKYDLKYSYFALLTLNINKICSGSGYPFLAYDKLNSLKLGYPQSLQEQQAIATVLSDMDELISSLDELIEKKKNIKKGAMQKLLIPKEGWTTVPLRDIAQILYGFLFTPDYYTENGKYRVITISNVHDGEFDFENCNRTNRLPSSFNNYQFLHIGDILISMTGNVGRVCCVDREGGVMNYRVGKFKLKENIDSNFLYHSLRQKKFLLEMIGKGKGGAQPNISQDDILEYEFSYPPTIEEQQEIATILSDMDEEIKALEEKKAKYENIKQGAMQKLLTGKIRLV